MELAFNQQIMLNDGQWVKENFVMLISWWFFGMIIYCTHQEYNKLSIISNVIVVVFRMFGQKGNIAKYLGSFLNQIYKEQGKACFLIILKHNTAHM